MRHTPRAGAHLHARARPGVPPRMRPFWKVVYLPGMHARVERASAARGGALKMAAWTNLGAVGPSPTRSPPSGRPPRRSAPPCPPAALAWRARFYYAEFLQRTAEVFETCDTRAQVLG